MFNAIGAHIYAGGFSLGVSKHFNVLAHLEHAAYGADVVKLNFPDLPIHVGGPGKWPRSWPKGVNRPRFMFANPPCAIWSGASHGRAGRWQDDPRLQMHHDIFNYATDEVGVDVLAIESVPPSFVRGREHVDILIDKASTRGYASTIAMHNAMYLGVPQNRSRIFYVFHKVAIPWMHPPFGEPTTVRQALRGIKPGEGYNTTMPEKYAQWARLAGPGEGLAKVFDRHNPDAPRGDRGQVIGRPAFLDARLPWDKPAGVIIGGKAIHPEEHRWVSQNELATICGFPRSYKWGNLNFNDVSSYMSRGVIPAAGEWLAENVNRALTDNRRLNTTESEIIDVRRAPGDRYPLEPVSSYAVSVADTHPRGKGMNAVGRPRALLTGSTPIQVGSDRTELKMKMNASAAWARVLEDLGYDTDWRAVVPGEDLSEYDIAIVVFNSPVSIASAHVHGALWTLRHVPAVIALDDWQINALVKGFETCARSKERTFRLRNADLDDAVKNEIMETITELTTGEWRYPILAAAIGEGDLAKIGAPGTVTGIDPTSYCYRYPPVSVPRKKAWIHASLLDASPPPGLAWPITEYGPQHRGLGGVGPSGAGSKPRLSEEALSNALCGVWGMLSPPRPFSGSSWWRARYLMAADAGCVLSADPREAACLGEAYVEASDPRRVERMSAVQLTDLARRQRECLSGITWPKERVKNALRSLLRGVKNVAKRVIVASAPPFEVLAPDREEGEKSGAYIRRLLQAGVGTEKILEAVHAQFPGSKAGPSDVAWNRGKLRKEGIVGATVPVLQPRKMTAEAGRSPAANGNGAAVVERPQASSKTVDPRLVDIGRSLEQIGRALAAMGGKS